MRRSFLRAGFAACLAAAALAGCAPSRSAAPAPAAVCRPEPAEIRAVWLTNVDSDVLTSRARIVGGLDSLAARGINVVFPVVWNKGWTLHPSDVMARTFGAAARQDTAYVRRGREAGTAPFDPLAAIVEEGHRRGMLVIPWFEFGFAASFRANGGHLLAARPGWAARDRQGGLLTKNGFEWMNAFHPEVQAFLLDLVAEVVRRYDVDGIQGDDRLPALPAEGDYSETTRALYRADTGADLPADPHDAAFMAWKARRLTDFGGRLYRTVKDADPCAIVSLSPSVWPWSRDEYLQDWPAWVRAGQVDWLHPQNYRYEYPRYVTTLDEIVAAWRAAGGARPDPRVGHAGRARVRLAPGVLLKAGPRYNGPAYAVDAARLHRRLGLDGEAWFFYEGLFARNRFAADSLRATVYR